VLATLTANEATLWTVVAAAAGAILGAAISALVTYRVTKRTVDNSNAEALLQRSHEMQLADKEIQQQRLYNAYIDVMHFVTTSSNVVAWQLREVTLPSGLPEPTQVFLDDRSLGAASLVSSGEVGVLVEVFTRQLGTHRVLLGSSAVAFKRKQQNDLTGNDPGAQAELTRATEALIGVGTKVLKIGDSLMEQMRRELGAIGELPATSWAPIASGLVPETNRGDGRTV
jgi:hypothetical protein